jgi:peptidoglycan/xylan/chitin deacetylase (PgdA/CDA1 family)
LAKHTLFGTARVTGVVALLRRLHRHRLAILCYHSIVDRRLPPWVAAGGLHLGVERFREQMAFLARHYRVIPLEALLDATPDRVRRPPARAVALTFDDGYENNLSLAVPILAEFGFPATIFLPTDYVGRAGLYWWDELGALLSSGLGHRIAAGSWGTLDLTTTTGVRAAVVRGNELLAPATLAERQALLAALRHAVGHDATEPWAERVRPARWEECRAAPPSIRFGGHGASHRLLDAIPLAEAETDLRRCGETLRAQLGPRASAILCYPGGGSTPAVQAAVLRAGFRGAVTASPRPAEDDLVPRAGEHTLLPRIGVSAETTLGSFAGQLAGLRRWLRVSV